MGSEMRMIRNIVYGILGCISSAYIILACRGEIGPQGLPGNSCTTTTVSTGSVTACPDGTVSYVYNGKPGIDGSVATCSTQQLSNGSETICSDGSHSVVVNGEVGAKGDTGSIGNTGMAGNNGTNGTDGQDAPISAYSIIDVLLPCGAGGGYDEVLLRLGDGRILGHFTEGTREFLSILKPGSYITASIPACYFSVDATNNLFNTHR